MKDSSRVSESTLLPELTLRGVILGALITVVFTASNVYLGLKVGLTFSSAIPAAVISMSVLRLFRNANILENNMVQTQASAAGTLSSVIFILPALVMMGYWQGFPFWITLAICAAGGMLGVVFTIPLRRVMVVQSDLPYPEGVAAAEILRVGAQGDAAPAPQDPNAPAMPATTGGVQPAHATVRRKGQGTGMADIASGGVVAAAMSFASSGLHVLGDSWSYWFAQGAAIFRIPMGFSLALLGAGYLIGIVAGLAMLLGLVIAWGVAVPVLTSMHPMPADGTISQYATSLWTSQVRFIGAGVIGVGAIWTLATLFTPMVRGMRASMAGFSAARERGQEVPRTEKDMPGFWLAVVTLVMIAVLFVTFHAFLDGGPVSGAEMVKLLLSSVLFACLFGFLVAAACGYMAGLVGSSASPISGVGIVGIVLVSLLLLAVERSTNLLADEHGRQFAVALAVFTTSAVIAVASISNDNLQDLKTGWLVGATPWRQQVALLIGCVAGAVVISPILELLYNAYGFAGAMPREGMDPSQALSAPQATLMLAIARGIFTHQLNWAMILIGAVIGVVLIVLDEIFKRSFKAVRLPILAVGIGIYLPPTISAPLVVGAVVAWLVGRAVQRRAAAARDGEAVAAAADRRGVLIASGLIVGESLVGVAMAVVIGVTGKNAPLALAGDSFEGTASWLGLLVFVIAAVWFGRRVLAAARSA
jgi:putative OPT family oligopeptide transporter